MKRVNNIYSYICNTEIIMNMYDTKVKKNTRNKKKIQLFEDYYSCNIRLIKELLVTKQYKIGKYNIFLIHEPKLRIIMSQEIIDKVINHLVANYFLVDVFDKSMLYRNCATRIGKGTHYALRLFKSDYNYYLNRGSTFYILKLDISKYFYNLDHAIIKELIRKKIKDKDVIAILDNIIDSTDEDYVNDTIEVLKDRERSSILKSNLTEEDKTKRLKEVDDLPLYKKGKGACIGNMVSQIIATFYLDELDKFIYYKLKCHHYARYMDDFYIIHSDKKYLQYCLREIKKILNDYKLELNSKTKIFSSNENVEFLGFVFSSRGNNINMRVTNKTKKKFKYRIRKRRKDFIDKKIDFLNYQCTRASYKGHLRHGNCNGLMNKYLN